ncbi:MAG: branched-chain amino acid ABC transporter permease [Deltaproteobacteria bacterium]|nr:branched-chain amino acid ABC transporter permease [Deltaproteobacteria bacterium]
MLEGLINSIDPYILQILVNIGIAVILALGLNVITGMTGQLALGHAAFMSIGAFSGALLSLKTGVPFSINLLLSGTVTAAAAAVIGWPILRLTGDYLAICTLAFAEIVKVCLLNLEITNKALGLSVPPPRSPLPMPLTVLICVCLAIVASAFIANSRFGRALTAIRDDEIAAESMGINCARYKVQSFAISAFMAGVGGSLYAHFLGYINPSDFGFHKSVDMLCMVVLGGLGSIPGALLGAALLSAAPEFLRFMAQYRMLVYGALLVSLMVFRPNGLLGGVDSAAMLLRKLGLRRRCALPPREGS